MKPSPPDSLNRPPLQVHYDPVEDVVTITDTFGQLRYEGDLFRSLAFPMPGHVYRVDLDETRRTLRLTNLTLAHFLAAASQTTSLN